MSALLGGGPCAAQDSAFRLTVRPHAMVLGTRTARAGEQALDSLDGVLVYVPPQAVGTRRVPLALWLSGAGQDAENLVQWHRHLADQYGMVLLAVDNLHSLSLTAARVDAALKQVLQKFAIDPDKIAVAGSSYGASSTLAVGPSNLDVFSRIAVMSSDCPQSITPSPQNRRAQFLLLSGWEEALSSFVCVRSLRQAGYRVEDVVIFKNHVQRLEDHHRVWEWFATSWKKPPARRKVAPPAAGAAGAVPLLTADAVARMTAFWKSFLSEPDLIRGSGRQRTNQHDLVAFAGSQAMLVPMTNMAALAAKYPPVAADFTDAGLTPQQHDAYRAAIVSALATDIALREYGGDSVAATSVLGHNVAFVRAHEQAIKSIGMWMTP